MPHNVLRVYISVVYCTRIYMTYLPLLHIWFLFQENNSIRFLVDTLHTNFICFRTCFSMLGLFSSNGSLYLLVVFACERVLCVLFVCVLLCWWHYKQQRRFLINDKGTKLYKSHEKMYEIDDVKLWYIPFTIGWLVVCRVKDSRFSSISIWQKKKGSET